MKFDIEDNQKDDFFDGPDVPEPEKKIKAPVYSPDDPRYWDQDEPEFEHLKPRKKNLIWWWLAAFAVICGIAIAVYLRYFSPYEEEVVAYGYVEDVRKQGTIFKTYEGVILPYKELMDTSRLYKNDIKFSTNDKTAAMLKRMQYDNRPVMVTYKRYHATLPWRGASPIIVVKADSVNPRNILPPEYQPNIQ